MMLNLESQRDLEEVQVDVRMKSRRRARNMQLALLCRLVLEKTPCQWPHQLRRQHPQLVARSNIAQSTQVTSGRLALTHVLSCTLTGIEGHVQVMHVSSCETDTLCRNGQEMAEWSSCQSHWQWDVHCAVCCCWQRSHGFKSATAWSCEGNQ